MEDSDRVKTPEFSEIQTILNIVGGMCQNDTAIMMNYLACSLVSLTEFVNINTLNTELIKGKNVIMVTTNHTNNIVMTLEANNLITEEIIK